MKLYLHDNTPAKPGENHGPDGPTHAGTAVNHPFIAGLIGPQPGAEDP